MLILTRNKGESIVLDGEIIVTVLDAGRNQARIGIAAPQNISIDREEIFDKKKGHGSFDELTNKLDRSSNV